MSMRFPVAIEPGTESTAFGVVVPDLLGCFSAGDTLDVTVDPAVLDDTVDRVNITLPRRVLLRLDALAKAKGETRSGYIAQLTMTQPAE